MNNKLIIGIIVVVIILAGSVLVFRNSSQQPMSMDQKNTSSSQPTQSGTMANAKDSVTIKNFSFTPQTLTVKANEKVTWTNQDSVAHSATADDGSFDTDLLAPGASGSFTFTKKGTFTYHCSAHPSMKATIIVE